MTQGRCIKYCNALTALFFLLPAYYLNIWRPASHGRMTAGFVFGLLWANWFEYLYHRWLMHNPGTMFEKDHREHHSLPEDEQHLNLGSHPGWTLGMFLVNCIPLVGLDWLIGLRVSTGMIVAFVVYVLITEEIHWRIHTGEWLPAGLGRAHHLRHHSRPRGNYNIFLPIFDRLLGTEAK